VNTVAGARPDAAAVAAAARPTDLPADPPDPSDGPAARTADALARAAAALPVRAWVEHHMGMPWSVHVRGDAAHDPRTAAAVERAFARVAALDAELSPFRAGSALNRLRRGELALADAPDALRAVHARCLAARDATDGAFDAWGWRDGFDPTGLSKGWSVDHVLGLLGVLDADVAVGAGGDVGVRSASGLPWRVGVEDPADRGRLLAHVDLLDGGVATSGTAAHGGHVVDPRTGGPVWGVRSATVVAADVVTADVWATTAMVLGPGDAPARLAALPGTRGVLVTADGAVHRWATP
jgi:thiamine biosynthesis lipoprotein